MRKYLGLAALGLTLTASQARAWNICDALPILCKVDPPTKPKPGGPTVAMPEPSAIPETILAVAGIGFLATRRRQKDQNA